MCVCEKEESLFYLLGWFLVSLWQFQLLEIALPYLLFGWIRLGQLDSNKKKIGENFTWWANFAFECFLSEQNSVYEWWKKFRFKDLIPLLILALTKRGLVFLFDSLLFKLVKVECTFVPKFLLPFDFEL